MAQRPVTLADIAAGHVSLEIAGFDRVLSQRLGARVADVRAGRRVAGLAGVPDRVAAGLGRISQGFRAAVRPYSQDNDVPWVSSGRGTGSWR